MRQHTTYDWSRLKGRIVFVFLDGWRYRRIVRVNAGKRKGLRSLRVASSSYEGRKPTGENRWGWNGPQHTVKLDCRETPVQGVQYRGRIIPVSEFCKGGVA